MNDQIEAARDRAKQVVIGLKFVRDQQERDVLRLYEHIKTQEQEIKQLNEKIRQMTIDALSKRSFSGSNPFAGF